MVVQNEIEDLEKRFRATGYSLKRFCDFAGISMSTWSRWKTGVMSPNLHTWSKVKEAVAKLEASNVKK